MKKITGILLLLIYICVVTAILTDTFVKPINMQNLVRRTSLYGILGVGMAFVIITRGIDLSIGSLIGLTGCMLPMLLKDYDLSAPVSIVLILCVCVAAGLFHGILVTKLSIQPFVVTLCTLLIYRGLARALTGDTVQGFGNEYTGLRLLANGKPCSFAFGLCLVGITVGLFYLVRSVRTSHRKTRTFDWTVTLTCFAVAIIGSSRFWMGWETLPGDEATAPFLAALNIAVPTSGERLPQFWMYNMGLIIVPGATIWLLIVTRSHIKLMVSGLILIGGFLGLVYGASHLEAKIVRMAGVFASLAVLMGVVAWFGRKAQAITRSANAPLFLGSIGSGLWLIGHTALGETLIPAPFFFLAAIGIMAAVFLNMSIYGRYLLALGNNEEAARYSGINTQRIVIFAYIICSVTAGGIGSVLHSLDGNSIQPPGHGDKWELLAIAAAVLGGCSLRGGEGTIMGVIVGTALIQTIQNSSNLLGIPSRYDYAILGTVLLIGVISDELVKRYASERRASHEALAHET